MGIALRLTTIISLIAAAGLAGAYFVLSDDPAAPKPEVTANKQTSGSTNAQKTVSDASSDAASDTAGPTSVSTDSASNSTAENTKTPSSTAPLVAPKEIPKLVSPTFDVVRVNPAGDAVIAGRAAPGASVSVMSGNLLVGTVKADERGEWVLIPEKPLGSGSRELSLEAKLPGADAVKSENVVVVAVPDRADGSKSLAILTPRKGGGPSKVLRAAKSNKTDAKASTINQVSPATLKPAQDATSAPERPTVTLDSVDYDEKGDLILSGKSDVGAIVNVYIDNKPAGQAVGDHEGTWELRPADAVSTGDHRLRVDQIGTDGKVAHRVELPFTRAEPAKTKLAEGQVVVQPGNSLWRIARHKYGEGTLFTVIYNANREQIRNPDLIYPGQVFALPKTDGSDG